MASGTESDNNEFLESIDDVEKLESLPDFEDDDDEEYDFTPSDDDLSAIPSWKNSNAPGRDSSDDEGYTLAAKDDLLDDFAEFAPDTTEIFGESTSTSPDDVAVLEEQRDAYVEALRQLQADFENYKKRVTRDNQDYADTKSLKLIEDLLPILDNFQLALGSISDDDDESVKIRKGIELVYADLYSVLEKQGLEKIDAQGALFDPEFHDAVSHEDTGEHEQEIVVEVLREGFSVRGRVVRPAMVKVAK